jgi:hypothetical protein
MSFSVHPPAPEMATGQAGIAADAMGRECEQTRGSRPALAAPARLARDSLHGHQIGPEGPMFQAALRIKPV